MQIKAFTDKTNQKTEDMSKQTEAQKEILSDKEYVIKTLKQMENSTKDFNLRYDLVKCIEILEGKENQEFVDLKLALEEVMMEKEVLFKEKCELAVEVDYLKAKEKKHRKRTE